MRVGRVCAGLVKDVGRAVRVVVGEGRLAVGVGRACEAVNASAGSIFNVGNGSILGAT